MSIRRRQLRKKTFSQIEQELFFYHHTKNEIATIRAEVMSAPKFDDNPGASRSTTTSDRTGNLAVTLADNKLLNNMQEVVEAIDVVYYGSSRMVQGFMDEFYFPKVRTLTLDGVADKLHISKRTLYRIRHRVVQKLAYELGWW